MPDLYEFIGERGWWETFSDQHLWVRAFSCVIWCILLAAVTYLLWPYGYHLVDITRRVLQRSRRWLRRRARAAAGGRGRRSRLSPANTH